MDKPEVLILASHFYPGFKTGGPPKSIHNLICALERDFSFSVFTRDRDVGDLYPYDSVSASKWNSFNLHRIYYAKPKDFTELKILHILSQSQCDLLYLNSFFGYKHSIIPVLSFLMLGRRFSCLIAPRGEFSPGALRLKSLRKKLYIRTFKFIVMRLGGENINWHATSIDEKKHIIDVLCVSPGKVHIAPNLPSFNTPKLEKVQLKDSSKRLDIVFISRITPKKNLDFLLRCLARSTRKIRLSVYGPLRDTTYWNECKKLCSNLPSNVEFRYEGTLPPEQIPVTFSKYHLFVFPTLGENYGHVIVEALSSSTPVLISNQTPWISSPKNGLAIQNDFEEDSWLDRIESYCDYSSSRWSELRKDAFAEWSLISQSYEPVEASKSMILNSILQ